MGHYYMTLAWFALEKGRRPRWKAAERAIDALDVAAILSNPHAIGIYFDETALESDSALEVADDRCIDAPWAHQNDDIAAPARRQLQRQLETVRAHLESDYAPLLKKFEIAGSRVWATGDIEHSSVLDQQTPDEALELFVAIQALTVYGILAAAGFEASL